MRPPTSSMPTTDDSLLVDISDALSERDRVRFTVHTRTKLAQFAKPVMSVVRQHEEFIWLHDCLEDNDQYAGYIIPPAPPRPDFDSSREKLQRLGDGEANMTKDEFAKMKQELESEYLAIFKKTVAMHEMFLQRLAAHPKFRLDNNFKIFLEYENELAVRCKSKKERLAGSIQNIGKSLTDFVITTSQVAGATTSASTHIFAGQSPSRQQANHLSSSSSVQQQLSNNGNINDNDNNSRSDTTIRASTSSTAVADSTSDSEHLSTISLGESGCSSRLERSNAASNGDCDGDGDDIDEQYFEKERLYLALYYNSIREAAIQADRVTQAQKCVADTYLYLAQQLVKLASIEVVSITPQTKDSSSYVACPLPSLTLPLSQLTLPPLEPTSNLLKPSGSSSSSSNHQLHLCTGQQSGDDYLGDIGSSSVTNDDDDNNKAGTSNNNNNINTTNDNKQGDKSISISGKSSGGCANDNTSDGLKQLLLHVSDYLEQAKKIETRIASDEDLKLTDTFLYYKRDTVAAQDLLVRRHRFLAEYETATRNLEKARQKGRTQMQYADVIQKQARENFISISNQAKQELIDYKQRRVASFKKAISDLVELELKHLRSHSQLITNCLNTCRGLSNMN